MKINKIFLYLLCVTLSLEVSTSYGFTQKKKKKNEKVEKLNSFNPNSTVKIVTRGEGQSRDEAINNALREALERTNQSFVSSTTLFSDDEISYDEIARVTNGNIAHFEVLFEGKGDNGTHVVMIESLISVTELATYVGNKGAEVKIKGANFVDNYIQKMNLALFYKENELKAIKNLLIELNRLSESLYDYKISTSEPAADNINKQISIFVNANITANSNYTQYESYLSNVLRSLSISDSESYKQLQLGGPYSYKSYYLRNKESVDLLNEYVPLFKEMGKYFFDISDNIGKKITVDGNRVKGSSGISIASNKEPYTSFKIKYPMDTFRNLESFSIKSNYKKKNFVVCDDKLASESDKIHLGFLGYRLRKTGGNYTLKEEASSIKSNIMNDVVFYNNRILDPQHKVDNMEITMMLTTNTLNIKFYSPTLYDFRISGSVATITSLLFDRSGTERMKYEAKINSSQGIGFPQLFNAKLKNKSLKLGVDNGESYIINVNTKLGFEKFDYKGKKYVRPTLEVIFPLDNLVIDKYPNLTNKEIKRILCRKLSLYQINYFYVDTNELSFMCYNKTVSDRTYTDEYGISNITSILENVRNADNDIKGFYPERVPEAVNFLEMFYKYGSKCNDLDSYGLVNMNQ